jgi:asparagine synthase (glutamine-hydrolysing)
MCENLYGVFAFILLDTRLKKLYFGRDTFGVRPCFKMISNEGTLAICSEAKGLLNINLNEKDLGRVEIVAPGSFEEYQLDETHFGTTVAGRLNMGPTFKPSFIRSKKFHTIGAIPKYDVDFSLLRGSDEMTILANIRACLTNAVRMRLMSHRRIGCLLSGGLDSSLIAGLVVQEAKVAGISYPIQTFSIGMSEESPDILAARKVAKFLNTEHHEVIFTPEEAKDAIKDVIYSLESYDITTIRASIGMYLLSKYIAKATDTVVLFSGEGADEIGQGYIYFYNAPDPEQGAKESMRLCEDLHYFDVCRADRTTAAHG